MTTAPENLAPLFVSTAKELWAQMRLSNVDGVSGGDAANIMRQAAMWARLELYSRLGETRVDQLVAIPEVAAPSTADQLHRSLATQLEIWLVKRRLLQDLPVVFKDKGGEALEQWNKEALIRDLDDPDELQQILDRLQSDIEDAYAILDLDDDTNTGMQSLSIGPADGTICPEPRGSVFRIPQNVWLRPQYNASTGGITWSSVDIY